MFHGNQIRRRLFPDEEGTETQTSLHNARASRRCRRLFPDEEGTETCGRSGTIEYFGYRGRRLFPDEEGTET